MDNETEGAGNGNGGAELANRVFYQRSAAERGTLPYVVSRLELGLSNQAQPPGQAGVQGFVQRLFSDRAKAEKSIVQQIQNEISQREEISRDNVVSLEDDILQVENWLLDIRAMTAGKYLDPERSLEFGSRRTALELKLLDLHALQREEQAEAWKDLSTLRRYRLFALRDFWNVERRNRLLDLGEGGEDESLPE